jgi:hypothetical protein
MSALALNIREELRETVPTEVAAYYVNRKPKTLRSWSSAGTGPIQPIRVHGRLHWKTADLKRLLGIAYRT